MKDSLRDIGNPNSTLKKYTFLQLLMVMVGEADMDVSDDDDDAASMSDGQSESTLGPNLDDLMMGAGQVKGVAGQLAEKEDVHQELIDEINILSGQAMSAIAAFEEYITQSGWRGRLVAFIKYTVLRERRVEEMFANEIFNLLDEDCTDVLDDYELDILRKALLVKIQRSNKAKPGDSEAENERVQEVKRVTLDIYNHIDNATYGYTHNHISLTFSLSVYVKSSHAMLQVLLTLFALATAVAALYTWVVRSSSGFAARCSRCGGTWTASTKQAQQRATWHTLFLASHQSLYLVRTPNGWPAGGP
jgi:hypothetical protein